MAQIDPIELSKALIRSQTLTPVQSTQGFSALIPALDQLKFNYTYLNYSEAGFEETCNLFASVGTSTEKNNLCFAGHLDVVPPGPLNAWQNPPFEPIEQDGMLIGRGTSDMKCAIACFIAATSRYITAHPAALKKGSISLLLTGDEEGSAINGTQKMLHALHTEGYRFDGCIVGEPTSNTKIADTIKIGRRGSITFYITIHGTQGHVAYPHLAKNPIPALCALSTLVSSYTFDSGTEFFDPSHLECVRLEAGDGTTNVIPKDALAIFNIRFSPAQNPLALCQWFETQCQTIAAQYGITYTMQYRLSAESFGGEKTALALLMGDAVKSVTGTAPNFSTSGGTSDARFIKNYTSVIEIGMLNATAHKINERVAISDIHTLTEIYYRFLEKWFARKV